MSIDEVLERCLGEFPKHGLYQAVLVGGWVEGTHFLPAAASWLRYCLRTASQGRYHLGNLIMIHFTELGIQLFTEWHSNWPEKHPLGED